MEKVIRGDMVAVLVSPGYGAGWFTWSRSHPNSEALLFDPEVVAWVEAGKVGPLPDIEAKYGFEGFFGGGADDLVIQWVPVGKKFRVHEYDGSESLVFEEDYRWYIA